MTRREGAIISAYTGILCGSFEALQELGDELMGRSTYTHEYGSATFAASLKDKAMALFLEICP